MGSLRALDYAAIGIYMALMAGIGLVLGGLIKSVGDYFKGGGTLPWVVAAISNYMSLFSAFIFAAYAGIAYEHGLVAVTLIWCTVPPALVAVALFAHRWRRAGIMTPVEYLETRFNSPGAPVLLLGRDRRAHDRGDRSRSPSSRGDGTNDGRHVRRHHVGGRLRAERDGERLRPRRVPAADAARGLRARAAPRGADRDAGAGGVDRGGGPAGRALRRGLRGETEAERETWADYLRADQGPQGFFAADRDARARQLSVDDLEPFWHYTRGHLWALRILDRPPRHPLSFLEPLLESDALYRWVKKYNWANSWAAGNQVLAGATALFAARDWFGAAEVDRVMEQGMYPARTHIMLGSWFYPLSIAWIAHMLGDTGHEGPYRLNSMSLHGSNVFSLEHA
jgi:hypothetical protein